MKPTLSSISLFQKHLKSIIPLPLTHKYISFYEYPEFTAYTLTYDGFTSDEKLLQHASQLGTLLERDGVDFVKD